MIGSGAQQDSQWLFPSTALNNTPSRVPLTREVYDRSRAVELLFRIGVSISLLVSRLKLLPVTEQGNQTIRCFVYRRHLVSSILHEIPNGGLSSPSA